MRRKPRFEVGRLVRLLWTEGECVALVGQRLVRLRFTNNRDARKELRTGDRIQIEHRADGAVKVTAFE